LPTVRESIGDVCIVASHAWFSGDYWN
jgi:hypothetical protein